MDLTPEILIDRIRLKSSARKWRIAAILALALLALALILKSGGNLIPGDYIARISIKGIIEEDKDREKKLEELAKDKHAKAVILYIDSPGGTLVGGETLYNALREIAKKKPMVATIGTLGASAGYLIATSADHIIANNGSLTGSIGVLTQSFEVTDLAKKLGINFLSIKSAPLKGAPLPTEKMTPEVEAAIRSLINDAYNYFVNVVAERRNIATRDLKPIADGRVYTGAQALKVNLVDEIGGEKQAIKWLEEKRNIKKNLHIRDVNLEKDEDGALKYLSGFAGKAGIIPEGLGLNGLVAIWNKPGIK
jgi:protease-4